MYHLIDPAVIVAMVACVAVVALGLIPRRRVIVALNRVVACAHARHRRTLHAYR